MGAINVMSRKAVGPVLAIDIGTSSSRTALFDRAGRRISGSLARKEYPLHTSATGAAELDPQILLKAIRGCLRETVGRATEPISGVGVSCFWHSLVPVGKGGEPLGPIYTWADSRCRDEAADLRTELSEKKYHARTGCMLRTSFWPAKLRWLAKHQKRIFGRADRWMSPAEWIQQELCDESRCALGMATGTGLFNPSRNAWEQEFLEACHISESQLNPLSNEPSRITPKLAKALPQLADAAWFPAIGDGAASNLGSGATSPGRAAINFGTSAALRYLHSARKAQAPFGLFCYRVDEDRYLVGGASSNAGNIRAWCLATLKLHDSPAAVERAPNWNEQSHSLLVGMTQATQPIDLLQALTEGTYQRLAMIAEKIPDHQGKRPTWIVGGGITRSRSSMQRLSNVIGEPLFTSAEPEASLRGAAIYALERLGISPGLTRLRKPFVPEPEATAAYRAQRQRLRKLEALGL